MEESRRFSVIDKELTEEESEREKRRKKVCTDEVVKFKSSWFKIEKRKEEWNEERGAEENQERSAKEKDCR